MMTEPGVVDKMSQIKGIFAREFPEVDITATTIEVLFWADHDYQITIFHRFSDTNYEKRVWWKNKQELFVVGNTQTNISKTVKE